MKFRTSHPGFRTAVRLLPVLALWAGGILAETIDSQYRAQVEQWRQQREAALKADGGWPTVTGLFWLKEGDNTVGSDASNDILLPDGSPGRLGTIRIQSGQAAFTAAGPGVTLNGKPVSQTEVRPVASDALVAGPLQLLVIKRGERLALRLKDNNSKARREFTHLSWYPVAEDWKIKAKFIPAASPAKIVFDTIIGEQETSESPGYVEFERGGVTYRLQAAAQGRRLFFVLRDQTSGKSTYAASRFLYADAPQDGSVILDFNKAENPPCAFTPYATCPLPPPQNRLALPITAGERKYEGFSH
ncbi:MAG: DUF1684 domain-containing protein [Candidatus Solibacter sp.]